MSPPLGSGPKDVQLGNSEGGAKDDWSLALKEGCLLLLHIQAAYTSRQNDLDLQKPTLLSALWQAP